VPKEKFMTTSQPILGIVPDLGTDWQSYLMLEQSLRDTGHQAMSFPLVRSAAASNGQYPRALVRQAQGVIQSAQQAEINQLILVGHGWGGLVGAVAAALEPALVGRVILLCPGGIYPDDTFSLLRRYFKKARLDIKYTNFTKGYEQVVAERAQQQLRRYMFGHVMRALTEFGVMARFETLKFLAAMGINAHIVYGAEDLVFDSGRIAQALLSADHLNVPSLMVGGIGHDPQRNKLEADRLVGALRDSALLTLP
jgi:pimeloyl-ACP methyl ester carboxylesterase